LLAPPVYHRIDGKERLSVKEHTGGVSRMRGLVGEWRDARSVHRELTDWNGMCVVFVFVFVFDLAQTSRVTR
jgi:hypothetical protein